MAKQKYRTIPILTDRQASNFAERVKRGVPDECWPWMGYRSKQDGRGYTGLNGQLYLCPRIAYALAIAEPGNLGVCHSCDNPSCCNPNHLFLGDQGRNMRDMVAKGRCKAVAPPPRDQRGANNTNAVLTEEQVREIASRYTLGSGGKLAKEFGICRQAIYGIVRGKAWTHIAGLEAQ